MREEEFKSHVESRFTFACGAARGETPLWEPISAALAKGQKWTFKGCGRRGFLHRPNGQAHRFTHSIGGFPVWTTWPPVSLPSPPLHTFPPLPALPDQAPKIR